MFRSFKEKNISAAVYIGRQESDRRMRDGREGIRGDILAMGRAALLGRARSRGTVLSHHYSDEDSNAQVGVVSLHCFK